MAAIAAGGGPMKTSPAASHAAGEGGILGEETVAGMHRVGTGAPAASSSASLFK